MPNNEPMPPAFPLPPDAVIARGEHTTFAEGANTLEWLWLLDQHPKRIPPHARLMSVLLPPEGGRAKVCPWTAIFVHLLAEGIEDDTRRQEVCLPLLRQLPGTHVDRVTERRRSLLAFGWLVQTALPTVLDAIQLRGVSEELRGLSPLAGDWIQDDRAIDGGSEICPWWAAVHDAYDTLAVRAHAVAPPGVWWSFTAWQKGEDVRPELVALYAACGADAAYRAGRSRQWLPITVVGAIAHRAICAAIDVALWSNDRGGDEAPLAALRALVPGLQDSAAACARSMMALRA